MTLQVGPRFLRCLKSVTKESNSFPTAGDGYPEDAPDKEFNSFSFLTDGRQTRVES